MLLYCTSSLIQTKIYRCLSFYIKDVVVFDDFKANAIRISEEYHKLFKDNRRKLIIINLAACLIFVFPFLNLFGQMNDTMFLLTCVELTPFLVCLFLISRMIERQKKMCKQAAVLYQDYASALDTKDCDKINESLDKITDLIKKMM